MLLRPRQKLFVERSLHALEQRASTLAIAPTGCHAPGTPILMFDGAVRAVEDIQVGDQLMGPDSQPRQVLEIHRGQDEMFEVRPIKGVPFRVNRGHILTLVRTNEGVGKRVRDREGEVVDIALSDYLMGSSTFRHLHKLLRLPADFPARPKPPLDPYLLGVLLGDGCLRYAVSVTTPDAEIVDVLYAHVGAFGLSIRVEQLADNAANTYHLVGRSGQPNLLTKTLWDMGLHGAGAADKALPDAYRLGNRDTRLSVLAGLLDTDGHLSRQTGFEFVSRSQQLADDVAFVARSLGFLATQSLKEVKGTFYGRVHISGDTDLIPTRVVRKQAAARRQRKNALRTGFTVHAVGIGDYAGFSVDGDHRYLMGDFTVTHNSGKTIMLSAVTGQTVGSAQAKACVLAHRDELTAQNRAKFSRVNPALTTSVVDASEKSWDGQVTFAMVPTLARMSNLTDMPSLDLLVIDEAHHAVANSYRRIIDRVREANPDARIYGVTATPNRGDKKGLREVFDNVADQIRIGELIASGHLAPPRTFVIDVGVQNELRSVRKTLSDFDMSEVASIMDRAPVTDEVIRHWKEKAGDRQTVAFCSTVEHAEHVTAAFNEAGVSAAMVHGEMGEATRKTCLAAYDSGEIRVIVNIAVLTEGWDHPPTSCVVLLRPSSYKSTMIQMVGRGLRTVDPEEYPGIVKTDCIVLDFGTSSLIHGALEQEVDLDGKTASGEAPTKSCPACSAEIPLATTECPLCGEVFPREESKTGDGDGAPLSGFIMSEIDLLKRSSFAWVDLFGSDDAMMATGFTAWGGIFWLDGVWYAVGGKGKGEHPHLLSVGERSVGLAQADDWLNTHETDASAFKTRGWLHQPPTEKQFALLPLEYRQDFGITRYQASALLTFKFNKHAIRQVIEAAATPERRAA